MAYQALYRKWRPKTFEEMRGQDTIVKTLKNQVKAEKPAHAYIFNGGRGTGKTTAARIMAKAINCENPKDGSPCCECQSCLSIEAGANIDVKEIDAASNNGVDSVREIREDVIYSPASGKYKVYIIDEAHMITLQAFNAFLKTLEEPPEYAVFIFATTEAGKIPITISSRCQKYNFKRISEDDIKAELMELAEKESLKLEERAASYIAKAADGAMRDALSLLDRCAAFYTDGDIKYEGVLEILGASKAGVYSALLTALNKGDTAGALDIFDKTVKDGGLVNQIILDFIEYVRSVLMVKISGKTGADLEDEDFISGVREDDKADLIKNSAESEKDDLILFIKEMSTGLSNIKYSDKKRALAEVMLIELANRGQKEIEAGIREEKKQEHLPEAGRNDEEFRQIKTEIQLLKEEIERLKKRRPVYEEKKDADIAKESGECEKAVKAMPEDLKKILFVWEDIMDEFYKRGGVPEAYKSMGKPAISRDGQRLIYVVKSSLIRDTLLREVSGKSPVGKLKEVIEEMTGFSADIEVRGSESTFEAVADLSDLVKMDIETEDREEYI